MAVKNGVKSIQTTGYNGAHTVVGKIADQNFYDMCFAFFYPTASATAFGQVRAEHSATAEDDDDCAYGPTLRNIVRKLFCCMLLFLCR